MSQESQDSYRDGDGNENEYEYDPHQHKEDILSFQLSSQMHRYHNNDDNMGIASII